MSTADYDAWLQELETKRDETPEQATQEALRALIRLTNILSAQRPPEEYRKICELILSGKCQVKFTVFMPPSPIAIVGELVTLDGKMRYPLLEILGEIAPKTTH